MASVNKVILLGNLGRDPETRYTADGAAITNISLATTRRYKNAAGEQQEETEWHRVSFFGRLAEIAGEYLRKGRPVYVEGRIRTRKYQDKESGQDRYSTEVVAESMQLLGSREGTGGGGDFDAAGDESAPRSAPPQRSAASRPAASKPAAQIADMDDDIPF